MRGRRKAVRDDELAALISAPGGPPDVGALVRTLARAVVHVPMPGQAEVASPRTVAGTQEGPPLDLVTDDDGGHALLSTTPQRLVAAWGATTAASIPFATLLQAWPTGSIRDVRLLQSAVDARRRPPGSRLASGLVHDLPQDLADPPYPTAGDALLELARFYNGGMDVEWDWSQGFPPGWPTSWSERLLGGRIVHTR